MGGQSNLLRKPSRQRAIALWKDQEKDIAELSEKLGQNLSYTDLAREGVDIVLKQLKENVKTHNAETTNGGE